MLTQVVSFIGLAAVLTAIPGPAIVLIMKSAVLRGRRSAATTALGVFCGDLVWVAASVGGLTAVPVASRTAFEVVRFLGAAYLLYLGVKLVMRRRGAAAEHDVRLAARRPARQAYVEGLLCELSNPKTLVVFTSVIPPFLPSTSSSIDLALFGVLFATVGLGSCLVYAVVLSASRRLVRRPRMADGLLRCSGGILVGFGVGLAVEGVRQA